MKIRVAAKPAFTNQVNPYNALLYNAILDLDDVVVFEHRYTTLPWKCDIFHIHWPEVVPASRKPLAILKSIAEWCWILVARQFGVKIVWTAHNAFRHDVEPTGLNLFIWKRFLSIVDGIIFLSEASRAGFINDYPYLRSVPWSVVYHGHYRPWINAVRESRSRPASRITDALRDSNSHFLILNFGRLLRYKNIDALISEFTKLTDPGLRLMIAGDANDPAYAQDLRKLAEFDSRITLLIGHLDDASLVASLDHADLVVLPYKTILNSGATFLALSFGKHVLAPAIGSMQTMRDEVGWHAITLYDGPINADILNSTISQVKAGCVSLPNLQRFDWSQLAQQTITFYKAVATGVRTQSQQGAGRHKRAGIGSEYFREKVATLTAVMHNVWSRSGSHVSDDCRERPE